MNDPREAVRAIRDSLGHTGTDTRVALIALCDVLIEEPADEPETGDANAGGEANQQAPTDPPADGAASGDEVAQQ